SSLLSDRATTSLHPLSLHDALPISSPAARGDRDGLRRESAPRRDRCRILFGGPLVRAARRREHARRGGRVDRARIGSGTEDQDQDRKSTRLNSSHVKISYAVFCLKK